MTVVVGLALTCLLILAVVVVWGAHESHLTAETGARPTGPASRSGTVSNTPGAPVSPGTAQNTVPTGSSDGAATHLGRAADQARHRRHTFVNNDGAKIKALGVSWEYNWSVTMPADTGGTEWSR